MSTRVSLLLSEKNEHWYFEMMDGHFHLYLNPDHETETDDDGQIHIIVKAGTALHTELKRLDRVKSIQMEKKVTNITANPKFPKGILGDLMGVAIVKGDIMPERTIMMSPDLYYPFIEQSEKDGILIKNGGK